MRIIPKKTKVKVEFYRNVSLVDIIIGVIGIAIELLLLFANFGRMQYLIMAVVLGVFVCLFLPVDGKALYANGKLARLRRQQQDLQKELGKCQG